MTERHYYVPTSDAHVAVWFYVRSYSNGAHEVETVIENGWLRVASPGHKTYVAAVTVAGTQRYSGTITHRHHCRWSRHDWTTGADLTPTFDMAYWRASKVVPNYGWNTPSNGVLDALLQNVNPTPMSELGNYPSGYGSGGNKPSVGLLPHWAALAFSSGNARAINSTIANARVSQRYATFYRDETTGRAPLLASNAAYTNLSFPLSDSRSAIVGWDYPSYSSTAQLPAVAGGSTFASDQIRDAAHACQDTYAAYLLTGRWTFMEHEHLHSMTNQLVAQHTFTQNLFYQHGNIRERSWKYRDLALAISMTPDTVSGADASVLADLKTIWQRNVAAARSKYCETGSPYYMAAGWLGAGLGDGASSGDYPGNYPDAPWQQAYGVMSLTFARDLEPPVSAQATTDLGVICDHFYKFLTGITGDGSAFSYRRADQYYISIGTGQDALPLEVAYTWAQIWADIQTRFSLAPLSSLGGNTLVSSDGRYGGKDKELLAGDFQVWPADSFNGSAHFGDLAAAAAMASDYSPSVRAGYNRLSGTTTWAKCSGTWNDYPICGIKPRA
jgi:hypothetical protein